MPTVGDVYKAMDTIAPFSMAEKWDNVGLLVGDKKKEANRVLLALDVTEQVIQEAVEWRAGLIITHHPVIFEPLKRIEKNSLIYQLIQNGIDVISAHTNLDIAEGGVNDCLAQALGLKNIRPFQEVEAKPHYKIIVMVPVLESEAVYQAMAKAGAGTLGNYSGCAFSSRGEGRFLPGAAANPYIGAAGKLEKVDEVRLEMLVAPSKLDAVVAAMRQAHPYEEPAYDAFHNYGCVKIQALGRIGELDEPVASEEFAQFVKEKLEVGGLKYAAGQDKIQTVAVCGGSGADCLWQAKSLGADALVTGETKHHLLLEAAHIGITLIDAGHFATETVVLEPLREKLEAALPGIPVRVSAFNSDGVAYL